jgi:2-polyprenyl-6-hydroxyphenyl methylase/3-demethylubiquinone-9 3-methyltransferase
MTKNVSQSELRQFTAVAQQWWDKDGPCAPLHQLNPIRMQFIESHAPLKQQQVLDVGCGAGILTESLAHQGALATGIDAGAEVIAAAKEHAQEQQLKINYQVTTTEEFAEAQKPNSFAVITCMELLEHIPNPAATVEACSQLLKPGGSLFFATINRTLKAYTLAIIGAEYILKLLPPGTHQYNQLIKPSELSRWCQKTGLQLQHMTGVRYHPLEKTFSLTEDVAVNYMMHFKKL